MTKLGRIIILNDSSRVRGGAAALAVLAARLLRARGHEVVFITGDDGNNDTLREWDVKVVAFAGQSLATGPKIQAFKDGLWNGRAAAFVADWIATEGRPDDVWHLHSWAQIWSPAVFAGLRAVRRRLVAHAHDYSNACPNAAFWQYPQAEPCHLRPLSMACIGTNCDKRSYPQKLWRVGRQSMLGRTFTGPDAPMLLLIHPGMVPQMAHAGLHPDRMQILRNPVTPYLPARAAPERGTGVIYVGRFDEEKGALYLAKAAARADVPVTFVGTGPLADHITRVCPKATLVGWQDHDGIARHAAGVRALVMPSILREPFGLVAVEALGSGIPVAVSHSALLAPEILAAGAGWSVDVRDDQAFDRTLRQICDAPADEIAGMSRNAYAAASGLGLTPDAWCDGLEAAYVACLDRAAA